MRIMLPVMRWLFGPAAAPLAGAETLSEVRGSDPATIGRPTGIARTRGVQRQHGGESCGVICPQTLRNP